MVHIFHEIVENFEFHDCHQYIGFPKNVKESQKMIVRHQMNYEPLSPLVCFAP